MKKILTVVAHPDDEILGCGGAVARLVAEGCEAYTLILGEGITSRDEKRDPERRKDEIEKLRDDAIRANKVIGVSNVIFKDYPDNRFDTVSLLEIVKDVERVKDELKPDIIFTHYDNDLNIDHQLTYKAVITASRPLTNETVKEILSFEIPSSTEWNCQANFNPDTFIDISGSLGAKLEAMREYSGEVREYPHPRSIEAIGKRAEMWGIKVGLLEVEAYKTIRKVR